MDGWSRQGEVRWDGVRLRFSNESRLSDRVGEWHLIASRRHSSKVYYDAISLYIVVPMVVGLFQFVFVAPAVSVIE